MTTGTELIASAMKKIGALRSGEVPTGDEATDGLKSLNNLLDSWANESLIVYARTQESFPLVATVGSYTIGPAQTFNTVRPLQLIEAHITKSGIDYPLEIIPQEVYNADFGLKTNQSSPSSYLTWDNGFPTATIKLYPVPSAADTLVLLTEKPFTALTLAGDVTFPPGYERALTYNLAVEIAPDYGAQVDPIVFKTAKESKAEITNAVSRNRPMTLLSTPGRRYSIYTDK